MLYDVEVGTNESELFQSERQGGRPKSSYNQFCIRSAAIEYRFILHDAGFKKGEASKIVASEMNKFRLFEHMPGRRDFKPKRISEWCSMADEIGCHDLHQSVALSKSNAISYVREQIIRDLIPHLI